MKNLYAFAFLIVISTSLSAQSRKKLSLTDWIKQHGYIALTDTDNLPKSIMPYYATIKDAVNNPHTRIKNFPNFSASYTNATFWSLINNKTLLRLTIFPIEGLKKMKNEEDNQAKPQYDPKTKMYLNTDVRSLGSVGEVILRLYKATNKITFSETE